MPTPARSCLRPCSIPCSTKILYAWRAGVGLLPNSRNISYVSCHDLFNLPISVSWLEYVSWLLYYGSLYLFFLDLTIGNTPFLEERMSSMV